PRDRVAWLETDDAAVEPEHRLGSGQGGLQDGSDSVYHVWCLVTLRSGLATLKPMSGLVTEDSQESMSQMPVRPLSRSSNVSSIMEIDTPCRVTDCTRLGSSQPLAPVEAFMSSHASLPAATWPPTGTGAPSRTVTPHVFATPRGLLRSW